MPRPPRLLAVACLAGVFVCGNNVEAADTIPLLASDANREYAEYLRLKVAILLCLNPAPVLHSFPP